MGSSSTSSSKRRFAVKLAVFVLLLVVLDAGVGGLLRVFYFRQQSGLNFRLTYAMERCTDDILVLGSSRAQAHYVPSVIEQELGKSCYNAGRDGQSLFFSYAVQQAVLKRYRPEVMILELFPRDFLEREAHYDRLSALLPYYRSHEEIRPIVNLRSRFERFKLMSRVYPFNSLPLQIVKYNLAAVEENDGYVPQYGEMAPLEQLEEDESAPWASGELDPNMVHAFESLVVDCKESGVRLVVVISPLYKRELPGGAAMAKVTEILGSHSLEVWDYSSHPAFANRPELFRDRSHLNDTGARIFSRMIAERIGGLPGVGPATPR